MGEEAVLKVGVPHGDFSAEMEALAIYEGRGINRLIDCDKALNAMLLERLRPGKMLDSVEDAHEQSEIAARILQNLHATPAAVEPHTAAFYGLDARCIRGRQKL